MKIKDYLVTILFSLTMVLLSIALLLSNVSQRKRYDELINKINALASQTDSNVADVHSRMDAIEEHIEEIANKNNNSINSIKKSLRLQVDRLNEKIDKINEEESNVEEEEEDLQSQGEKTAVVAAATIIKDEHSTMIEIDDTPVTEESNPVPSGAHLTPEGGVFYFGNQLETYYNLDMSVIVQVAHSNGISGEYWVREDGCKMLGSYIMLACNRDVHPYGSLVETSLGTGISLDTGGFAANNPYQVDIATTW